MSRGARAAYEHEAIIMYLREDQGELLTVGGEKMTRDDYLTECIEIVTMKMENVKKVMSEEELQMVEEIYKRL